MEDINGIEVNDPMLYALGRWEVTSAGEVVKTIRG